MKDWNIFKHTFTAIIIAVVLHYFWGFITIHEASAIGIIGGADGPTSIFISNKATELNPFVIKALLSSAFPGSTAFIIIMLLYKPIKVLVRRKQGYK